MECPELYLLPALEDMPSLAMTTSLAMLCTWASSLLLLTKVTPEWEAEETAWPGVDQVTQQASMAELGFVS